MRLKVSVPKELQHNDVITCVGWNNTEEIYSCGDDHLILKCSLITSETQKVTELPLDVFPTDFHLFSRGSSKKSNQELMLLTSSDGRFHLIGKNGRIEKSVEAHKGAVLVGQWSPDGTTLITGGEDGTIKMWSRSGMLRSTVVQGSVPIYTACWGPNGTHILYAQSSFIIIKPLAPNTKPNRWKGHDGLILKSSWDHVNSFIITGGEDCKYKVWDSFGRPLYSSSHHDYPITSLSWSPNGTMFAVGSYNTLRLCDKTGWSHHLEKPQSGSLYAVSWSPDGTQLAAACTNRRVLIAHVIGRKVEWGQYEAESISKKVINVIDSGTGHQDRVDCPERVVHMELAYKHLAVVTSSQCYLYPLINVNTSTIIDLREGSVSLLRLSEKYVLLVEKSMLNIYGYDGRLAASPKWPSLNTATLNPKHISISPDMLSVRDQIDEKLIQLVDIQSKDVVAPMVHSQTIHEIALSQCGTLSERLLAFTDKNRDIYLAVVTTKPSPQRKMEKLGNLIESFVWNSDYNILAGLQDTSLITWYYPNVLFADKSLLRKTTVYKDSSEFGRSPSLINFVNNQLSLRRSDGSLVVSLILPFIGTLYERVARNEWKQALKLCRQVKEQFLWSCLAAMATHAKNLETAEMAYAAIDAFDKVVYIQNLKRKPGKVTQAAGMLLLGGNIVDAETILLQNGMVFRAIWSNIEAHKWIRALEIAVRYKTHVETVLLYRKRYLESFGKNENNEKFIQLQNQVQIDEKKVEESVAKELSNDQDSN